MLPRYDARVITRTEAVRLLEDQHGEIAALLERLDEDAFVRRGTIGGGEWSAKDLAAHLGAWEEIALGVLEAFERGERPGVEDEFGEAGAVDRINDREVARFLDATPAEVLARFEDLHRRLVAEIEATPEERWDGAYPFDPDDATLGDRIGSLIGSDAGRFTHASAHLQDLRAYVEASSA